MEEEQQKNHNPNPEHHPHIQALLDLEKAGFPVARQIIDVLMSKSDEMKTKRANLVATWNAHQYPDKAIRFIMSCTYDVCPERFSLSIEAQALLSLMERLQSKSDGYIAVKKGLFAQILGLRGNKKRRMQIYLDELKDGGFITCISTPPQGSKAPAIYKINRELSWIGGRANKSAPSVHIENFEKKFAQTIEEAVLPDGTKIKCGSLSEYQETPAKKGSATDTDPSELEPADDSANTSAEINEDSSLPF